MRLYLYRLLVAEQKILSYVGKSLGERNRIHMKEEECSFAPQLKLPQFRTKIIC